MKQNSSWTWDSRHYLASQIFVVKYKETASFLWPLILLLIKFQQKDKTSTILIKNDLHFVISHKKWPLVFKKFRLYNSTRNSSKPVLRSALRAKSSPVLYLSMDELFFELFFFREKNSRKYPQQSTFPPQVTPSFKWEKKLFENRKVSLFQKKI